MFKGEYENDGSKLNNMCDKLIFNFGFMHVQLHISGIILNHNPTFIFLGEHRFHKIYYNLLQFSIKFIIGIYTWDIIYFQGF